MVKKRERERERAPFNPLAQFISFPQICPGENKEYKEKKLVFAFSILSGVHAQSTQK
jgi:hypothetical protein